MCMSACSAASTSPSIAADVAGSGSAIPELALAPATGGDTDLGGGGAIRQDTGFDPADPVDQSASLAAQLQQAQQQLVPPVTATPATSATAVNGAGPASGGFRAAVEERLPVQLQAATDGAAAIANLDRIVEARTQRLARIEEAFFTDPSATPSDQAQLDLERTLLADTAALRDKLATMADTIDANEAAAVLQVVGAANQRGSYHPEQLAELMIQVEGSALGMPSSYLELAMRAQDLLEQTRNDMDAMVDQAMQSNNGQVDAAFMTELDAMASNQLAAQEALKANFELAKRDPATAQAQLQAMAA